MTNVNCALIDNTTKIVIQVALGKLSSGRKASKGQSWHDTPHRPIAGQMMQQDGTFESSEISGPDPTETPLTPVQFHRMLAQSGKKGAIYAAIDALPAMQRDDVLARIEYTLQFKRIDPLFDQLGAVDGVDLTPQDIDALWVAAASL